MGGILVEEPPTTEERTLAGTFTEFQNY